MVDGYAAIPNLIDPPIGCEIQYDDAAVKVRARKAGGQIGNVSLGSSRSVEVIHYVEDADSSRHP